MLYGSNGKLEKHNIQSVIRILKNIEEKLIKLRPIDQKELKAQEDLLKTWGATISRSKNPPPSKKSKNIKTNPVRIRPDEKSSSLEQIFNKGIRKSYAKDPSRKTEQGEQYKKQIETPHDNMLKQSSEKIESISFQETVGDNAEYIQFVLVPTLMPMMIVNLNEISQLNSERKFFDNADKDFALAYKQLCYVCKIINIIIKSGFNKDVIDNLDINEIFKIYSEAQKIILNETKKFTDKEIKLYQILLDTSKNLIIFENELSYCNPNYQSGSKDRIDLAIIPEKQYCEIVRRINNALTKENYLTLPNIQ